MITTAHITSSNLYIRFPEKAHTGIRYKERTGSRSREKGYNYKEKYQIV
jgi:hypothetical protein